MIRVVHPGSRILTFYPSRIPDPGVKKAPDPGSGSATLLSSCPAPPTLMMHNLQVAHEIITICLYFQRRIRTPARIFTTGRSTGPASSLIGQNRLINYRSYKLVPYLFFKSFVGKFLLIIVLIEGTFALFFKIKSRKEVTKR
jgi:hypothetical protein